MNTEHEALPPIERDEDMDRTYIPVAKGWEIQTKGKGSSFRIAETGALTMPRYLVADDYLHDPLERMARDIHASTAALQKRIEELEAVISKKDEAIQHAISTYNLPVTAQIAEALALKAGDVQAPKEGLRRLTDGELSALITEHHPKALKAVKRFEVTDWWRFGEAVQRAMIAAAPTDKEGK